jgi:hypothetical protein
MITLSPKNPMRVVLLSVLAFEIIIFGLAVPVMIFIGGVPAGPAAGFGGGAALLALLGVATLRRPGGYLIGWVTQLAGLALGFLISTMFIVGIMFAAIWVVSFILGKRLDNRPQQA